MSADQAAALRRKHYNASVVLLRKLHSDLMILRLRPDFAIPVHRPGQYTTLGLGYWEPRFPGCQEEMIQPGDETKLVRRAYSISSSVLDEQGSLLADSRDWLEFYIVLVRDSGSLQSPGLTPRLFLLRESDRLYVGEKITGHYTVEGVPSQDVVLFLSTGTGEAPNNYMLWELLRRGHSGPILAACCVRYRKDLGYLDQQNQLMRKYPNYTYLSLTTREADNRNQKVYIQDLIASGQMEDRLRRPLDPKRTHVYLCGNPKMIGVPTKDPTTGGRIYPQPLGVIEILEKRGFRADQGSRARGNIHFEEYW